jgi:hypothetical protein
MEGKIRIVEGSRGIFGNTEYVKGFLVQKDKGRNVIWVIYRELDVKSLLKIGFYSKPRTELEFLWSSGGSMQRQRHFQEFSICFCVEQSVDRVCRPIYNVNYRSTVDFGPGSGDAGHWAHQRRAGRQLLAQGLIVGRPRGRGGHGDSILVITGRWEEVESAGGDGWSSVCRCSGPRFVTVTAWKGQGG